MPGDGKFDAARLSIVALGALALVALILGIATGAFDEAMWNLPPASPTDPITVP